MTTETPEMNNDLNNAPADAVNNKAFTEDEVQELIRKRTERERENSRLLHEDNKRLKSKLEELESKMQKGTASDQDMVQLQAAKQAAAQGQAQGYTPEQVKHIVAWEMQQKELGSKLEEAREKDPEFAKLIKDGNKIFAEEVAETAYLPNAPAVVKYLMKDQKSLMALRAAWQEGRSQVMMVLNNLSDRLSTDQEKPAPSQFKPAEQLSDASDDNQNFDEKDYISSKY
jgi:uncharacterized membrane protein YheB (UPF0754 family)